MGNYENLKQSITEVIRTNGNQEITGAVLQSTLLTIISTVGANATFAGIATPATNPGTPDGPAFWLASESGTYTNFNAIELQDGLSVLMWNSSWSSQQILGVDDVPTARSNNLVKSGGVYAKLYGKKAEEYYNDAVTLSTGEVSSVLYSPQSGTEVKISCSTYSARFSIFNKNGGSYTSLGTFQSNTPVIATIPSPSDGIVIQNQNGKEMTYQVCIAKNENYQRGITDDINDIEGTVENLKNNTVQYYQNLFNPTPKTESSIWNIINNEVSEQSDDDSNTANKIQLEKGVTYFIGDVRGIFSFVTKRNRTDYGDVITKLSDTDGVWNGTYTPTEDCDLYLSYYKNTASKTIVVVNSNTKYPLFNGFNLKYGEIYKVDVNGVILSNRPAIEHKVTTIVVAQDGSGDFVEPISAIRNISDSSEYNQYLIEIHEGIYDLQNFITTAEQTGNRWGMTLPNYVHLKGVGNVTLRYVNDNPTSANEVEWTSVLNVFANNTIENIKFVGKNVRYVVHDESSNTFKDFKRIVKDCTFEHLGNDEGYWQNTGAWGEGCSSGSISEFYNCRFINHNYANPFGFHTNEDYDNECYHKFVNCSFENDYTGNETYLGAFGIQDLQSGKVVVIEFIHCQFQGFIWITNGGSETDWEDIVVKGYGNDIVTFNVYRPNVASPKPFIPQFSDCVRKVRNMGNASIPKGVAVSNNNYSNNSVIRFQSNGLLTAGITLEEIPAKGTGFIQYAGLLQCNLYNITSPTQGSKLGVNNWNIVEVEDNYFATVPRTGFIKFIN